MSPLRVLLIYNPLARGGRGPHALRPVLAALADEGVTVEPQVTAEPDHATELARAACRHGGYEAVFALGGDGTVREAAAGLLGSELPLAILPAGTVNVVARALGIPLDAVRAARLLARARPRAIDIGRCNGEPFLMSASAGLDARVMAGLEPHMKRHFGALAVLRQGLRDLWRYEFPEIRVRVDGRLLYGTLAVVCNLPYYAGPFRMAPAARLDDGKLQLVVFAGGGRRATLSFALDLARGRHLRRADVQSLPVERIELEPPAGVFVQIDGDARPMEPPVVIEVAREQLLVMVPAGAGEQLTAREHRSSVTD